MRLLPVSLMASVALAHAQGGIHALHRRHYGEAHDVDSTVTTTSTRYHTSTVYESHPSSDVKPEKVCKKKGKNHESESAYAAAPVASPVGKVAQPYGSDKAMAFPSFPQISGLPKLPDFLGFGKDAKESKKVSEKPASVKPASIMPKSVSAAPSASASASVKPGKGGKKPKTDDPEEEDKPQYASAPAPSHSKEPSYGAAPSASNSGYQAAAAAASASPSGRLDRGQGRGPRPSDSAASPSESVDPNLALNKPSGSWLSPAPSDAPADPAPSAAAAAPSASSEEVVVVYQTVNVIPVEASASATP